MKGELVLSDSSVINTGSHGVSKDNLEHRAIYEKYVHFLVRNDIHRERDFGVKTDREFSQKFSISPTTVANWKTRDHFVNDIYKATQQYLATFAGKYAGSIVERMSKDANYARLYRDMISPDAQQVNQITIENLNFTRIDTMINKLENILENE